MTSTKCRYYSPGCSTPSATFATTTTSTRRSGVSPFSLTRFRTISTFSMCIRMFSCSRTPLIRMSSWSMQGKDNHQLSCQVCLSNIFTILMLSRTIFTVLPRKLLNIDCRHLISSRSTRQYRPKSILLRSLEGIKFLIEPLE